MFRKIIALNLCVVVVKCQNDGNLKRRNRILCYLVLQYVLWALKVKKFCKLVTSLNCSCIFIELPFCVPTLFVLPEKLCCRHMETVNQLMTFPIMLQLTFTVRDGTFSTLKLCILVNGTLSTIFPL